MKRIRAKYFGYIIIGVGIVGILLPFTSFRLSEDYKILNTAAQEFPNPDSDPQHSDVQNRIIIPSVGVDMAVFSGKDPDVLLHGAWVFPSSTNPNASSGNVVIFGHRFRYLPPISNTFYHLDEVQPGDQIKLVWNNRPYVYVVRTIAVVDPNDLSMITETREPILTLVTCTPLFSTKHRLVVTAVLIR